MTGAPAADVEPFFLEAPGRRLFALAARPRPAAAAGHGLLLCPPLFEEMNHCRPTVRRALAAAAGLGLCTLSVDLTATGDSEGGPRDADWSAWIEDLARGAAWLRDAGCRTVTLLAIRAGALLAEALAARDEELRRQLLWQPTLTGRGVVTELLRARVAAAAAAGGRETVAALREQLAAGDLVEAAGYSLRPALVTALEAAELTAAGPLAASRVGWLEIGSDASTATRPAAAALAARLREAGATVALETVADPPFWSTVETTLGTATVAASARWLEQDA